MIDTSNAAVGLLCLILLIGLYFLPLIIAATRHHHQTAAIAVLDLFLGWTFIGWVLALIWAASATPAIRARS
jgi:hypothetical protein